MKRKKAPAPAPPLSRIGQRGTRPMAKPIKEKREIKLSKKEVSSVFSRSKDFFRKNYMRVLGVVALVLVVFVTFFTSTFAISSYRIQLDKKSGCLTEEYVNSYVRLHIPSMWSHIFFTDEELRIIHPCLERLRLQWNPFHPKVLDVFVTARQPVLRVKAQLVNLEEGTATTNRMFEDPVASEEVRFMLPDGRLVQLDANPDIPEIAMRYTPQTQLENVAFAEKDIVTVLQLHEYLMKEYGSATISVTETGIAHFSLPTVAHVYTTVRQDLPVQLGSLQAILGTSTIDRSKLLSIDVRSGRAVLRY